MKLPWTRQPDDGEQPEPESQPEVQDKSFRTPGKGRPTPKRRDAAGGARRGPVPPAPLTSAEARARRKALAGPKLTREERREQSITRKARQSEARARMLAGDDAYLLARDKGPVRAYVRDIVDSRRSLAGAFMPIAFVMIGGTMLAPQYQTLVTPAMLVLLLVIGVEGLWFGRKVNNMVLLKFPDTTETGLKLGWYAFTRSTQLRRMRVPKPRVKPGDSI